jgi:transposase
LAQEITEGHAHDSPIFETLVSKLPKGDYSDISGDTSYSSRKNCNLSAECGLRSYFKPQCNATSKAKGSRAWHDMINLWKHDPEIFYGNYHRRSVIESIIYSEKERLGYTLFSRKDENQSKEMRMRTIAYNLLALNKVVASDLLGAPPLLPAIAE